MADKYVTPAGNDSSGDGSILTPWRNIQKFLSVAADGDRVYVQEGNYAEPTNTYLLIDSTQNGKHLIIEGFRDTPGDLLGDINLRTTYTGASVLVSPSQNNANTIIEFRNIKADSFVIDSGKYHIDHRGAGTILWDGGVIGTGASVADNAVSLTGIAGATGKFRAVNSTIQTGGYIFTVVSGTIAQLEVDGCTINGDKSGGDVFAFGASTKVTHLKVTDNVFTLPSAGLLTTSGLDADDIQITGNTISCNGRGIYLGHNDSLPVFEYDRIVVADNTVVRTGATGGHCMMIGFGCVSGEIYGNKLKGLATGDYVMVAKAAGVHIHHNRMHGANTLYVHQGTGLHIHNNTLQCTSGSAFSWEDGTVRDPKWNVVHDNIFDASAGGARAFHDLDGDHYGMLSWNNILVAGTTSAATLNGSNYTTTATVNAAWQAFPADVDGTVVWPANGTEVVATSAGITNTDPTSDTFLGGNRSSPGYGTDSVGGNIGADQSSYGGNRRRMAAVMAAH